MRATADAVYSERLTKLANECGSHTQLILMLSPTNQLEDEELEPALKAAAESLGVAVIEPVAQREWPMTKFREDQYHLNPAAAAEFSRLVATDLRQQLADPANRISGQ